MEGNPTASKNFILTKLLLKSSTIFLSGFLTNSVFEFFPGMIVVNNDVTLESLLCRAQKGEVTLLAQAKEDGTFILVENTTTQQETRETAVAEESAVQTSHGADSIMQSADDSINTNAVSADTAAVNDDVEIQHNIAKEERKTVVTSKICKIQEDRGQVDSYKFEQQNVNDLVVEAVPSGIVDQQGSNKKNLDEDDKDTDNDDVMETTDQSEAQVAFEDDMPAETKCTEYSEVASVVSTPSPSRHRQLEVTSSVVKRLRHRSGM